MRHFINIILAKSPAEMAAAEAELRAHNAAQPSDREAVASFLKDCTTLDGKPLAVDASGAVVIQH
ncbi:hypothetical protein LP417_35160 (plasmid) [Polaromonas sp. P1-6]|nr:hypothetical protein LP417_35160 [Polaromonas sp. P1-6]